jgi:hypothetical protein
VALSQSTRAGAFISVSPQVTDPFLEEVQGLRSGHSAMQTLTRHFGHNAYRPKSSFSKVRPQPALLIILQYRLSHIGGNLLSGLKIMPSYRPFQHALTVDKWVSGRKRRCVLNDILHRGLGKGVMPAMPGPMPLPAPSKLPATARESWSDHGQLPIVIDAASCTLGLVEEVGRHLDEQRQAFHRSLKIIDSVTWCRDLLQHLNIARKLPGWWFIQPAR